MRVRRLVCTLGAAAALGTLGAAGFAASGAGVKLTGVNIAGAEFGARAIPGRPGTDYFYPSVTTIGYVADKGMNVVRVPFLWERLQPALAQELDAAELRRIDDVVTLATTRNLSVILDVHNYAAYRGQPIGSAAVPTAALADLWGRLAQRYKSNPKVIFGLMNEPKGLRTETWLEAANAAISAVRQRGARNLVLVPGNGWTGAHSWTAGNYGRPNGEVMREVSDPLNNFAYEVHQYLDSDFSGTHPSCRSATIGVETLKRFTQWARQTGKRGFLGEFGAAADPTCLTALDSMLTFMSDNGDVWLGWTYWAAGAWPPSYFTSVQPVGDADRPQMTVLLRHLAQRESRHGQSR